MGCVGNCCARTSKSKASAQRMAAVTAVIARRLQDILAPNSISSSGGPSRGGRDRVQVGEQLAHSLSRLSGSLGVPACAHKATLSALFKVGRALDRLTGATIKGRRF